MFDIQIVTAPLIGSVIGYFTNYIAVKMLFRPLKPVKIGKFTLPFTPGIIPKGRTRLAHAIGDAVGSSLLTDEVLQQTLLSEDMLKTVEDTVDSFVATYREDDTTLKILLGKFSQNPDEIIDSTSGVITDKILKKADEMQLGNVIANQVVIAVKEKAQGTMLAMVLSDSILESISPHIATAIDKYVKDHGDELVRPRVKDEAEKFMGKTTGSLVLSAEKYNIDIKGMVLKIYEEIVRTKLKSALDKLSIAGIIEDKINSMDMLEIENLTLKIMKKELNAIVWLGAVIGFILGLFNLLF